MAFSRVAIVNRGESGVRGIRGCNDYALMHGVALTTVAFVTEADAHSLYPRLADEVFHLGKPSAYLDYAALERALLDSGVDAAWVGWGFVAEHAEFAELCTKLGITFIGPSARAMRLLGDKMSAKRLAEQAEVPVAAWTQGPVRDVRELYAFADELQAPFLLKATAGGGGRGVRFIDARTDVRAAFESASGEALRAFGNGDVYAEELLADVRHIEVQIIADSFGTVWAAGTRDCTVQRRHQKLLEEAPAVVLPSDSAAAIEAAAIRLARAAGYHSVGTVEFLFHPATGRFVFMEMNTRLQVEHTVTEVVTGLDLVGLQLHIARGGRLPSETPPAPRGFAIEARVNADDPARGLQPAPGKLAMLQLPGGAHVRVDSGYSAGDDIPTSFDSMVAKVIAWGATRDDAVRRLDRALSELKVLVEAGATNKPVLLDVLRSAAFLRQEHTTAWFDARAEALLGGDDVTLAPLGLALAAISKYDEAHSAATRAFIAHARRGRLVVEDDRAHSFRLVSHRGGGEHEAQVRQLLPRRYLVELPGAWFELDIERHDEFRYVATVVRSHETTEAASQFAERYPYELFPLRDVVTVELADRSFRFAAPVGNDVRAPGPGSVLSVHVAPGQAVEAGALICVLEAMKTEVRVRAAAAGVVTRVHAVAGIAVKAGAVLAEVSATGVAAENAAPAMNAPAPALDDHLRSALLGFDVSPSLLRLLTGDDFARALAAQPERRETLLAALQIASVLLEVFVPPVLVTDGTGRQLDADSALSSVIARGHLGESRVGDRFKGVLRELLALYAVDELDWLAVSSALSRADRGRARLQQLAGVLARALEQERFDAGQAPDRRLLDRLIAAGTGAYAALGEAARRVRFLQYERLAAARVGPSGRHPELGRLAEFETREVLVADALQLIAATARAQSHDTRLFCFVSIDTPPALEAVLTEAALAMRDTLGARDGLRATWNRILLHVESAVDAAEFPAQAQQVLAGLAPVFASVHLEKVALRYTARDGVERVLHVAFDGKSFVRARLGAPSTAPIRSLPQHQRKSAALRRRGLPYAFDIIRMLAPNEATLGRVPRGSFVEYDLVDGSLQEVRRPWGENRCGVVLGLVTNFTALHPEGMRRVVLLGDASHDMGSLSEPECRRVIAAIDWAARDGLPLEWYPVSAGAAISMQSGTENLDWTARVLKRIIEHTEAGGEINIVVDAVNVGAQAYWNAEATMLMHCRGVLIMTPAGSMVLTGKKALEFSGSVSAPDHQGIGGLDRIMGPNGQAQYAATDLADALAILFRYYALTYRAPGEARPRIAPTADASARDVGLSPYDFKRSGEAQPEFPNVGAIFSETSNPGRRRQFDTRCVMRAVVDADCEPLERWAPMRGAESAIVWDARLGGITASVIGIEGRSVERAGFVPADGPEAYSAGTLFPLSSKKVARALNAASGCRPVVVLANLAGFDGSPESLRKLQLEYGSEIGRAVVKFQGPIVFIVLSRYHGGAYVVFSKALGDHVDASALEGSYASVIGGAPAAAIVFRQDVRNRLRADPRVVEARQQAEGGAASPTAATKIVEQVERELLAAVAAEFDAVHDVHRAARVGSIDRVLAVRDLRPHIIRRLAAFSAAAGEPGESRR